MLPSISDSTPSVCGPPLPHHVFAEGPCDYSFFLSAALWPQSQDNIFVSPLSRERVILYACERCSCFQQYSA